MCAGRGLPAALNPLDPPTTAWLAGLIDGEGSFTARGHRIACSVVMTDRDVIDQLYGVVGAGTVVELSARPPRAKTPYLWRLQRNEEVQVLAEAIGPLLSVRRRARLTELGLKVGQAKSLLTPEGLANREAAAWVAGLLEAEGSFYRLERRGVIERRILLEMTDVDVVDRYAVLTKARRYTVASRRVGWSPTERAIIYRKSDCFAVVDAVRPWLLSRRGLAADVLVKGGSNPSPSACGE